MATRICPGTGARLASIWSVAAARQSTWWRWWATDRSACTPWAWRTARSTAAELDRMCEVLDRALSEGAIGFSTGLIYSPCVYGDTEELIALGRVVAKHDAFMVYHMRYEGKRVLDGHGRGLSYRPGIGRRMPHLAFQGAWPSGLGQGAGDGGSRRGGPRRGTRHHRRPVPLPRRQHDARRAPAAVVPCQGNRGGQDLPARSGPARDDRATRSSTGGPTGKARSSRSAGTTLSSPGSPRSRTAASLVNRYRRLPGTGDIALRRHGPPPPGGGSRRLDDHPCVDRRRPRDPDAPALGDDLHRRPHGRRAPSPHLRHLSPQARSLCSR